MAELEPLGPRREAIRALLAAQLPWSPHEYIPRLSKPADRAMLAEEWTRDLPPADDLRWIHMSDGSAEEWGIFAERLPWDSSFFGYDVARLNGIFPLAAPLHRPAADLLSPLAALMEQARQRGVRYLFASVDPRDLALLRALGAKGFALIETRLFHHGPVREPELAERFAARRAVPADVPSLTRVASQTINPYDRFHADPFITADQATRLMETWVEQSVLGRFADVTIVPDMPEPTAFVTYRYHKDKWARWGVRLVQGVLSAVAAESMGWMGKLGPEVNYHLAREGAEHSFGSTQVTNRAILWFAQEAGARFGRCEHVFRVIL